MKDLNGNKMKQSKICPNCGKDFPLNKQLCSCGSYRVTEDNYQCSYKEILAGKKNKEVHYKTW
jgi:predicted amidophosphoribosyltransferase